MEKYLKLYAEPEAARIEGLSGSAWSRVLVIPACNESTELLRPPPRCDGLSLLILVVNQPGSAGPGVAAANRELAAAVRSCGPMVWEASPPPGEAGGSLQLFADPAAGRDILLVDRFSPGRETPPKGGVGYARKIGCDLALALFAQGRVGTPWIHCSDGDVELPDRYFEREFPDAARTAAMVYPFEHVENPAAPAAVMLATRLYELSLRYYVAGLKFAGSPYAFHTIGSTLAVNARHYARVRGFPKRDAGEDFYLLNKLAKVGDIQSLAAASGCPAIRIRARCSDRVPFGTGAAVNTILGSADPIADYRYYHPAVFDGLRSWLQSWTAIWNEQTTQFDDLMRSPSDQSPGSDAAGDALAASLAELGAGRALEHAFRQSTDRAQFTRQMHTWFDAFRTLKLIHSLRNRLHPSIGLRALAVHPGFMQLAQSDPELEVFFRSVRGRIGL